MRLGREADLALCLAIDDGYTTTRVWQMDAAPLEAGWAGAGDSLDETLGGRFRPVRLPRPYVVAGAASTRAGEERLAHWHEAQALLVVGPRPPPPDPPAEDAEEGDDPDNPPPPPPPPPPAEVWGYALLGVERAESRAWVRALVVGTAHRGHGLGGRLLRAAQSWARAEAAEGGAGGLAALAVALPPQNYPATAFCRHYGFRFCGYTDYTALGGAVQLYFVCPLRG